LLAVSVTPWTVLPPAAPGATAPVPTAVRLAVYAGLMALGVGLAVGTYGLQRWLCRRYRAAIAGLVAGLVLVASLSFLWAATPNLSGTSPAPAALESAFRGVVVFGQVGLWAGLATVYARLHPRAPS
ncbi:MAG: CbtA family protein, partial [Halobacteriales archaeon]|nr:CbtA family protein [Halobacteriales archaeon]